MPFEVFSGARAKFFIGSNPVGFCAGVSGEEAINYEPVDTIDFLEVREHIPVAYRASLSAAFFRLINSPLKQYAGKNNETGGVEIFPKLGNILTSGALSAAIVSNKVGTGAIIAKFEGVRAASKTFDVSARGVVTENCSFIAIKQMDESELENV